MEDESHRETRARTLIECLHRLQTQHPDALLHRSDINAVSLDTNIVNAMPASVNAATHTASSSVTTTTTCSSAPRAPPTSNTTLTVHLVGADHREGNTGQETCVIFDSFFQSLAEQGRFETLQLVLVGPNIARLLHQSSYSQLWTSQNAAAACTATPTTAQTATATPSTCQIELQYFVGSFDEYYLDAAAYLAPDLAVCFNAGIWGYDEWLPSLRLLLHTVQTPLLVTSYNENEAMDDEDMLETLVPPQWFWRAEKNPHGSLRHRATRNAIGSVLKENDYWMCLGPSAGASAAASASATVDTTAPVVAA